MTQNIIIITYVEVELLEGHYKRDSKELIWY